MSGSKCKFCGCDKAECYANGKRRLVCFQCEKPGDPKPRRGKPLPGSARAIRRGSRG